MANWRAGRLALTIDEVAGVLRIGREQGGMQKAFTFAEVMAWPPGNKTWHSWAAELERSLKRPGRPASGKQGKLARVATMRDAGQDNDDAAREVYGDLYVQGRAGQVEARRRATDAYSKVRRRRTGVIE